MLFDCCCIVLGNVFYTLKIIASMILAADVTFKLAPVSHTYPLWNNDLLRKEAIQTNLSLWKAKCPLSILSVKTSSKGNNCCEALQFRNAFTSLWRKFWPFCTWVVLFSVIRGLYSVVFRFRLWLGHSKNFFFFIIFLLFLSSAPIWNHWFCELIVLESRIHAASHTDLKCLKSIAFKNFGIIP